MDEEVVARRVPMSVLSEADRLKIRMTRFLFLKIAEKEDVDAGPPEEVENKGKAPMNVWWEHHKPRQVPLGSEEVQMNWTTI